MTIAVCVLIMALTVISIVLISRPQRAVKQNKPDVVDVVKKEAVKNYTAGNEKLRNTVNQAIDKHNKKQQEKRQTGQFRPSYKSSSQPPLRHTDSGHYSWVHTTDVPDDSPVRHVTHPHPHDHSHDHSTPSYDHRPEADIAPIDSHSSWSSGSDSGGGGASSCSSGSDSGSSSSCGGSSCGGGD